ncbi:MAG: OmpA family protein [Chitinophagaceae bacterium]
MKKWLLILLVVSAFSTVSAQDKNLKKRPSFGFQFSLIDFQTAKEIRATSLGSVLSAKQWYKMNRYSPAITVNYMQGLTDNIDFMGRLTSSFLSYPLRNPNVVNPLVKFHLETDANANIKLLPDNFTVVPYVQVGVGAGLTNSSFLAYIPLGVGLQVNIWNAAFLQLNSNYRVPVTSRANYNFMHSIGFVSPLFEPKKVEKKVTVPVPEPPKDRDGDGILDDQDACPDVAGVAAFNGCPDTDKDGIADKDDKCPDVAGLAKYNGCPVPDTDKDGINDENDKCPNVAGVARYEGCPVPDGDGDGVNDEEDKCPTVAGDVKNAGCPLITYNAGPILFNSSSATLLPAGKKELDKLVEFLNTNKDVNINIVGNTDNSGDEAKNQTLSEKRAASAKDYLIKKGIDGARLFTSGIGSSQPVGNNETKEGRAQNRRVEVSVKN